VRSDAAPDIAAVGLGSRYTQKYSIPITFSGSLPNTNEVMRPFSVRNAAAPLPGTMRSYSVTPQGSGMSSFSSPAG